MAGSLGSLVVTLGLDATEFVSGLTKSEYEARKFAQSLERGVAEAARLATVAVSALAAAAGAAFVILNREIESVASYKKLSESIGTTAENFAALQTAASTSGTSLEEIAGVSIRLSAALSKIGEGQDKGAVAAALTAIGLSAEELRKLDPVDQLEKIALALAKFEDGSGKAAVAVALLGRGGAQALPFLNDLADAGGRQVKLTQEQIEAADRYTKASARTKVEIQQLLQVIAVESIPAMTAFKGAAVDVAKALLGIDAASSDLAGNNGAAEWAKDAARALAYLVDAGQGVIAIFQLVGKGFGASAAAQVALLKGDVKQAGRIIQEYAADADKIFNTKLFSDRLEERLAAGSKGGTAPKRPRLNFTAIDGGGNAAKDKLTDAERYLKTLEEQFRRTEELTVLDRVWGEIEVGALKDATAAQKAFALGVALEIDQRAELKKRLEDEARAREQISRATTAAQIAAAAEVAKLAEANEALRNEIALIGADAKKREQLAQAINNVAIARKQDALFAAQSVEGMGAEASLLEDQIRLLKERGILIAQKGVADKVQEDAKKAKEFVDSLGLSFASAFEDAIVSGKGLHEVLVGLEKDIIRIVTRKLVTEPLAASIAGLLGNLGVGSAATSSGAGGLFSSLFGSLFSGGGGGASGLTGGWLAGGTDYARGGPTLVGERGPEIVNMPRGAQVIPNSEVMARRGSRQGASIVINQNFAAGTSRATVDQAAVATGRTVQRAMARNG